jgi:mono/diheme cytochrome c family protein
MARSALRAVLGLATAFVAFAVAAILYLAIDRPNGGLADPRDLRLVTTGREVYAAFCASCHGKHLEGEPNWQTPLADGRMPAPPHDETGHTWHHSDELLFNITRDGMGAHALGPYESNMPSFGEILTDKEIWAVIAFIKSRWPSEQLRYQQSMSRRR